ncbi:MAG: prepilin-type N-terminal cleavage/methylation domain-containing protein [Armatimonadetes bacterium]|nr:prepilin-type N-terminal cleavage/methylation domain-containing protein [Armatimonadota bacterium]
MACQSGFSLVEGLVVAALLAILVVVAVPRLMVPETLHARSSARQLAADLRLAQRLAIARRANVMLEFSPSAPPYTGYIVRQEGGGAEPDFPKNLPQEVSVTGPLQFVFSSNGSAAASGTVTLTASGATATVQVTAATGHVKVTGP